MSNPYEDDILLWSEAQADLLRRHAAGERLNDAAIDWPNIAEEIEDVGRSELHIVESLLVQSLRHMLKAYCWPLHRDADTWRADAIDFRQQATRRFAPSMRQRLDMERIYRHARRGLPDTIEGQAPLPLPADMPTLDELLADDP
jgi:hypothetical protein